MKKHTYLWATFMATKRDYVEKVVISLITKGVAALILWVLAAICIKAATLEWKWLEPYSTHALLLVGSVFTLILVAVWKRLTRRVPSFPSVDCDFHLLKKEIFIDFISPGKIIYLKKFKLRALRDNLTHYEDKYHWTGSKPPLSVESTSAKHTVIQTVRRSMWQLYEVKFDHPHKKNDTVDVEVVWTIEDEASTHTPFISTTIEEPTDELVLRVRFDDALGVKDVLCEHRHCMSSNSSIESSSHALSNREYSWSIKQPRLLHHYEIRWVPKLQKK